MSGKVIRFSDYERKSRECDAALEERDPTESGVIIILPVIRVERQEPRRTKRKSR